MGSVVNTYDVYLQMNEGNSYENGGLVVCSGQVRCNSNDVFSKYTGAECDKRTFQRVHREIEIFGPEKL